MDLTVVNRHSARMLAFAAVSWSCLGGFELGRGVQEVIKNYGRFDWVKSFMFGSAFLAFGIFWVVRLVRRAGASGTSPGVLH